MRRFISAPLNHFLNGLGRVHSSRSEPPPLQRLKNVIPLCVAHPCPYAPIGMALGPNLLCLTVDCAGPRRARCNLPLSQHPRRLDPEGALVSRSRAPSAIHFISTQSQRPDAQADVSHYPDGRRPNVATARRRLHNRCGRLGQQGLHGLQRRRTHTRRRHPGQWPRSSGRRSRCHRCVPHTPRPANPAEKRNRYLPRDLS